MSTSERAGAPALGPPSPAHRAYLRRRRQRAFLTALTQLLLLVALVGGWEWAAATGRLNAFVFSMPSRIWALTVRLVTQDDLLVHLGATVYRTLLGFGIATALGVVVASLLWWSPFWARVLEPYLIVLNSVPKVSLGPLFIVWLGMNVRSVLAMTVAISLVVTIVMLHTAFRETDPNKILLLRSFGANRWQVFQKVVFPAAVPTLIGAVKVNIGLAWVGTILGEFLVAGTGLGYLIVYGGQVFNMTLVLSAIVLLLIVSTALYYVVDLLERRLQRIRGAA
ncbi:MAG: ABC transporter permease [Limnochordales bacterium]|jgi:ABC-type nitrate/sulfonate/bicarbonate transport system, permease component|nr:sulfonate ABC transporter permease [Bacillota bacterium]